MKTDTYTITGGDSELDALEGIRRLGRFAGMDAATQDGLGKLCCDLVSIARGLDAVQQIGLWMEAGKGEAVVHLLVDCQVDMDTEEELQELSSTGENTERRGLINKIKGFFEEMAIADNEELHTLGYVPGLDNRGAAYPVLWTLTDVDLAPSYKETWNDAAAADVERLADCVDVGFASDKVEIAAHVCYLPVQLPGGEGVAQGAGAAGV